MTKVNLTLFVNENKKTNPLAPPYTNSKFQPKHDIVLKADTAVSYTHLTLPTKA